MKNKLHPESVTLASKELDDSWQGRSFSEVMIATPP